MARKKVHIVFSFLLLALLLFVQIGANFCHTHDCHQLTSHKELGAHFEKKSDECSICHLQISNPLFFENFNSVNIEIRIEKSFLPQAILETSHFSREGNSRAPPLV